MRLIVKSIPLALLALFTLLAAASGQIEGDYEAIAPLPAKHSLDVVVLEEFLNFTCPHCNNFRKAAKPLLAKYGKRLRTENVPILFRGQPDFPLRLYYIAEKAGRTREVKEAIFDATFLYGVNIYDPKVVGYLARSVGLAEEFSSNYDAEWVSHKIREAQRRADSAGVQATPTIVLNGSIRLVPRSGMQAFVANLDRIIAQLLKNER